MSFHSHLGLAGAFKPAAFALAFAFCCTSGFAAAVSTFVSPEEAVQRMTLADGLRARLVTSEPHIRQPLSLGFDYRGRLWVLQFLQYPDPAGIKVLKADEFWRRAYDRVPEPPPAGPQGADRITICEDTDGDGRMDRFKDFVGGLNMATGFAVGPEGVYVLQAPYLLYYPDRNHDDIPDGPPEVLLSGFGMQDTHAMANSLQWGPDGWLYGAQGSNIISKIRGIEFNQGIWRYHPETKEFEEFAEGGGNTYALDFDRRGQAIAGTNFNHVALHHVQGAYYVKAFEKHGQLHNPYAFGYFEHLPVDHFKGGHLTIGGIVYSGGALPERFEGAYIASNILRNSIYWHRFERDGSSFKMYYGGDFLVANDSRFRVVDCLTGPDGAVYLADWATRISWPPTAPTKDLAQSDPRDDWTRSSGRIYKVEAREAGKPASFDLRAMTSRELVGLLGHSNQWFAEMSRQLLAQRQDASVRPALRRNILEQTGQLALESLWALHVSGGLDDEFALQALAHPNEDVRAWTIRFLGDTRKIAAPLAAALERLAGTEPSPAVRNQLACSARRWPAAAALPLVRRLLHRAEDTQDPQIPLLLWWAVESKAVSDRAGVLALLESPADWQAPLIRDHLVERLARRYVAEETEANLTTFADLLVKAPGKSEVDSLIRGAEKALAGRTLEKIPAPLAAVRDRLLGAGDSRPSLVRFAIRLGDRGVLRQARSIVADRNIPADERVPTLALLGQITTPENQQMLLRLLDSSGGGEEMDGAVLAALQSYSDPGIASAILARYPGLGRALQARARALLANRESWALALVQAVDQGDIGAKEIPIAEARKLSTYDNPKLGELVVKHWGKLTGMNTQEQYAMWDSYSGVLAEGGRGDGARGKTVFDKTCAACHTLFGEGGNIGPDLTAADRNNTRYLVENIVSPNLMIRPEYVSYNVATKDGRTLNGFVVESNEQSVTLLDLAGQRTTFARANLDRMEASPISLMPEGLLQSLSLQEVRDLFAYLQRQ